MGYERTKAAAARWIAGIARHPIPAAIVATAVVSCVFLAAPGIDVAVAGLFRHAGAAPGAQFPAERIAALKALRASGMAVTRWATVIVVCGLLAKAFLPLLARAIPMRPLLFLATSLAIGPGLVVNTWLKEWWGRPRPMETTLLGGDWNFMPAWIPGGACPTNCSFPSGEASGAAWLVALVFVVPPAWRARTAVATVAWTLAISLNRMAFGKHFLSDVLIGWGLIAIVVLVCREVFLTSLSDARIGAIEAGFARFGRAVTDRFSPR